MHSRGLVSSSLQTQFEYPRQQHSENALYIHVALTFTTMKELFFHRQSIKDDHRCLFITATEKGELGKSDAQGKV